MEGTGEFRGGGIINEYNVKLSLTQTSIGEGPTSGAGISEILVRSEERNDLWVIESLEIHVAVWDFMVGDATLLPTHKETLDEVIRLLTEDSTSCRKLQVTKFSPVRGFASQTGPEKGNLVLAKDRANVVADYLSQNGRDFFSSPEFKDHFPSDLNTGLAHPFTEANADRVFDMEGVETPCNRAASFHFRMTRKFVDLYTEDEILGWLQAEMAGIRSFPENEREIQRLQVKAKYWLGRNFLDMVEADLCQPTDQASPAWHLFHSGLSHSQSALGFAFNSANARQNMLFIQTVDAEVARRREAIEARDDYHRMTYKENPEAKGVADAVETEIFGDSVPWIWNNEW